MNTLATVPVTPPEPSEVRDRVEEINRWLNQITRGNPERAAIVLTDRVRENVANIRSLFLELAPIFLQVRDHELYRYHPERFSSFEEWLAQPEIDISHSKATDMINFWLEVVPAAVLAGIDVDEMAREIGDAKLRLLVPIVRNAKRQQQALIQSGMTPEQAQKEVGVDIAELTEAAKRYSWRDLREWLRPTAHDQSDLELQLITEPIGDGYWVFRTKEPVHEDDLMVIDRKLRPQWYDPQGRFRPLGERR